MRQRNMRASSVYKQVVVVLLICAQLWYNGLNALFAQDSAPALPERLFLPLATNAPAAHVSDAISSAQTVAKGGDQSDKAPTGGIQVSNELFNAIEAWSATAKSTMSLLEFVEQQWPEVGKEAALLQEHFQKSPNPNGKCTCDTLFAFELAPEEVNAGEEVIQDQPWPPSRHFIKWWYAEQGAAHMGKIRRDAIGGSNRTEIQAQENQVRLRTRILCEDPRGNECEQGLCQAQLDFEARYGSRANVTTQAWGWPFSHGSAAVAADTVRLSYDPPGTGTPAVELIAKGHGVDYSQGTSVDVEHVVGFLQSAAGITLAFLVTQTNSLDQVPEMVNEGINHLAHLYHHEGNGDGNEKSEMLVTYDTAQNASIPILSGYTHVLELKSVGAVQSRGYGPISRATAEYGSSYSLAGAIHHAECQGGVQGPSDFGFAAYSYQNGPSSLTEYTLCKGIESYLWVTLGDSVDCDEAGQGGFGGNGTHTHASGGRLIPVPQPPTARCTANPDWGIGSVNATFSDNGSTDADGSIIEYRWTVDTLNTPLFGPGPHSHTFQAGGQDQFYSVRLKVTDNSGLSNTAICTVEVACVDDGSDPGAGFFCMH